MKRPSPAMVVALLALVLSAGAGGYAANGLITSSGIKNGTIKEIDLNRALRAKIAKAGQPGPAGPQGPSGGLDRSKVSYTRGPDLNNFGFATQEIACPAGQSVLSGGVDGSFNAIITRSAPNTTTGAGWLVNVRNAGDGANYGVSLYIVCVAP